MKSKDNHKSPWRGEPCIAVAPTATACPGQGGTKEWGADLGKGGKAKGKGAPAWEKRSRAVYFAKFPDDTDGKTIKTFIDEWTKEYERNIEESYSIGHIGERGAARFWSEDAMWEFVIDNKGKLTHEVLGVRVCASADSMHDSNPTKTTSQRKMIRAIIEAKGGMGTL